METPTLGTSHSLQTGHWVFPGRVSFEEELDYEAIQGERRDLIILSVALRLIGAGIHSASADQEGGGVLAPPLPRPIGSPVFQAMARSKVFDFRDRIIGPEARHTLDERREVWIELNDDFVGAEVRLPMACDSTFATVEARGQRGQICPFDKSLSGPKARRIDRSGQWHRVVTLARFPLL